MEHKKCIIQYNEKKIKVIDMCTTIKIIEGIYDIFNKITAIINNLQDLISKFSDTIFNNIDNINSCRLVLLNNIKILYDNIIILFSTEYKNIKFIHYSINDIVPSGYSINLITSLDNINCSKPIIYVNSYKVKFCKKGIIKIIEYDDNIEPINVSFIGTHLNLLFKTHNMCKFNKILSKCFNNNLKTINYIKIIILKYINIINNLKNLYK